jgi:hypothetical protein
MKNEELQSTLDTLETPSQINHTHKRQLKHILMSKASSSSGLKNLFLSYYSMSLVKKVAPLGIVAVVAIALVVSLVPNSHTPQAQAQELVNRSIGQVMAIPAQTREEIEKNINADMEQTLEEAKHAPDLHVITKEEFEKEDETDGGSVGVYSVSLAPLDNGNVMVTDGITPLALNPDKYLRYTNPQGQEVTIGLDEHEVLVFKLVKISGEEAQKMEHEAQINSDILGGPVKVEFKTNQK